MITVPRFPTLLVSALLVSTTESPLARVSDSQAHRGSIADGRVIVEIGWREANTEARRVGAPSASRRSPHG